MSFFGFILAAIVGGHNTISQLQHIIIIMQENRSFDSYFGTYPGADGIPMKNGVPTVCLPNPGGPCVRPYHDSADENFGGPHDRGAARNDINGGLMDGFVRSEAVGRRNLATTHFAPDPFCHGLGPPSSLGYKDGSDIPNYWALGKHFTLMDHMFD